MSNKKSRLLTPILFLLFFWTPLKAVEYITEQFPPYNFKSENGQVEGLNVDVLVAMFEVMNNGKSRSDIKIQPWSRGIKVTQTPGKQNVLFSTTRTPERESLYKWVGPLSIATNAIIVLKGNPAGVSLDDAGSLSKFKFGAVRDDLGEGKLKEMGVPKKNVSLSSKLEPLIKRLQSKRVDAISYNYTVASWAMKNAGINPADFEVIKEVEIGRHYFAFNKSVSDDVVAAHQKALDSVKSDQATMNAINEKYLK